jgi:membrane associated rhomboid family serine protease
MRCRCWVDAPSLTQTLMTLAFGTTAEARVPNLGASGAIAAVLGAYFVLYPNSTVRGLVVIFPVQLSAWFFLGAWFLYQLIEANFGIFGSSANGAASPSSPTSAASSSASSWRGY